MIHGISSVTEVLNEEKITFILKKTESSTKLNNRSIVCFTNLV